MSHPVHAPDVCAGTRFRIFAQPPYLPGFEEPELLCLSAPPGTIGPGPADARMYVVDAIDKRPYRAPRRPPYTGPAHPPAAPDAAGHFDHLPPESRAFRAAQMYATVRTVLEMWERYAATPIAWDFAADHPRLELVPQIAWGNAHAGHGYLETGFAVSAWGRLRHERPYCLNFDVVAHETGHPVLHALLGRPEARAATLCYAAFHETFADLSAVLASLHSRLVVDRVLVRTKGHLRTQSALSRIGELSHRHHIRSTLNDERLFRSRLDAHTQALPLVGALFDVLIEIFETLLVEQGLLEGASPQRRAPPAAYAQGYDGHHHDFQAALWSAGDRLGRLLGLALVRLSPRHLTCPALLEALLDADQSENAGRWREVLTGCFSRRGVPASRPRRNAAPPPQRMEP